MQFPLLISSLINIISLDVTSFNSAVTLKLKCGKVVCVEFFIFGDRSSVAYRATENLSRFMKEFVGLEPKAPSYRTSEESSNCYNTLRGILSHVRNK